MEGAVSKFLRRCRRLWDSQVDHTKVDEQIQAIRLKYEIYRTRI
ncbi:MAG: hypothetical protein AB7F86_16730 [Bdellovibrionales bacterium]